MRVLVACEESQTVCKAFRELGHQAFSCDVIECSGGEPQWHIQRDVLSCLGKLPQNDMKGWDLMIAHPPCTFMSKAGARWMFPTAGNLDKARYEKALEAKEFFMKLLNTDIPLIAVENPFPLKVVGLPEPTQTIQPYEYGHKYSKKTLLWLKGLPKLEPTDIIKEHETYLPSNTGGKKRGQKFSRGISKNAKESSKTFSGIAKAMAEQWGGSQSD